MGEHRLVCPQWTCAADGCLWPCELARKSLAEAYDPVELVSAMAWLMARAAEELLPAGGPARLYGRFLGWTHGSDRVCRLCARRGHDAMSGVPVRLIPCEVAERLG